MIDGKPWYQSKIVLVGILQTVIGSLSLVADLLGKSQITPQDATLLSVGILTVVLRIWFTDLPIQHGGTHDSPQP
jgi:hypothetical protein